MKLSRKLLLVPVLLVVVFITSCILHEEPKGTIQFTVTFPGGDNYQQCTIPEGTDRFAILIYDINHPDLQPKYTEIVGEPGETVTVEIEIPIGTYEVVVSATKQEIYLPSLMHDETLVILAGGKSDPVEVLDGELVQAIVVLEEVIWDNLDYPSEVIKGTVYSFGACFSGPSVLVRNNPALIGAAFDENNDPISFDGSKLMAISADWVSQTEDHYCCNGEIRINDFEETGKVRFFFMAPSQGGMLVSPAMEANLVKEDSETGIVIIIQ